MKTWTNLIDNSFRYAFKSQDLKTISQDKKQIQGHQRTEKQFLRIQIQGQYKDKISGLLRQNIRKQYLRCFRQNIRIYKQNIRIRKI